MNNTGVHVFGFRFVTERAGMDINTVKVIHPKVCINNMYCSKILFTDMGG